MATTEKMTVHKALTELKTLDDRIEKIVDSNDFVSCKKHVSANVNGIPVTEWEKQQKAAYKAATDLINRKTAIKRAVTLSNAITKVNILGTEYTVAEAIAMKNGGMESKEYLLRELINANNKCVRDINQENKNLEGRAALHVETLYGKTDVKNQSDEIQKARQRFMEEQTIELVDPIGIAKVCEKLNEEIHNFEVEVDGALSVSNALTEIEISY